MTEEQDSPEPVPPSVDRVKRRLMILWTNAGRSYFEDDFRQLDANQIANCQRMTDWFMVHLASEATEAEISRHKKPLGSWPKRDTKDDSWDTQAAQPLAWALGLIESMPPWNTSAAWPKETGDFFDLPDPTTWLPGAFLRHPDEIEQAAQSAEACYWRARMAWDRNPEIAYGRRLMGRAHRLGQVLLAPDGDLAMADGTSIATASRAALQEACSTISERLTGLNWLCGHQENWDEITADTIVSWLWDREWPDDSPESPEPKPMRGLWSSLFRRT